MSEKISPAGIGLQKIVEKDVSALMVKGRDGVEVISDVAKALFVPAIWWVATAENYPDAVGKRGDQIIRTMAQAVLTGMTMVAAAMAGAIEWRGGYEVVTLAFLLQTAFWAGCAVDWVGVGLGMRGWEELEKVESQWESK